MSRLPLVILLFALSTSLSSAQVRVACIGDSITFGHGLNPDQTYPALLQKLLGNEWIIKNFGAGGTTVLANGDKPYVKDAAYANAKAFQPDVAILALGTNDAKPRNWRFKQDFQANYKSMISDLSNLPSHPTILIGLPVPAYGINYDIDDRILNSQIVPLVRQLAKEAHLRLIDLYRPLQGHPEWFQDKIHPTAEGAKNIAMLVSVQLLKDKLTDTGNVRH
jgi:acyl-CoA thioesterase I